MNLELESSFHAYIDWLEKDQRRVSREWDHEWDGSASHGIKINDCQCERIDAARAKYGITDEVLRDFMRS